MCLSLGIHPVARESATVLETRREVSRILFDRLLEVILRPRKISAFKEKIGQISVSGSEIRLGSHSLTICLLRAGVIGSFPEHAREIVVGFGVFGIQPDGCFQSSQGLADFSRLAIHQGEIVEDGRIGRQLTCLLEEFDSAWHLAGF